MGKEVYANGREISAKKDDNQSTCAMPDVCLSPPSPPAGPIPIPYPNTSMGSDTSNGSKTVKVGGDEVGLKNASNYKKSTGDEAATKSLGMGVVTHNIQGPSKHAAWSFDVKIEGANAIRHMDITTHNYMNVHNTGAMILNRANQKIAKGEELTCEELERKNKEARETQRNSNFTEDEVVVQTASFTPPGGGRSTFHKAMTPQEAALSPKKNGFADPNQKKTMACSGERYGGSRSTPSSGPIKPGHARSNVEFRNHTEGKIIEQFFSTRPIPSGPPGSVGRLKTKISKISCWSCKRAICAAVRCGLEIVLCNNKNDEVNAEDLCRDGQPEPAGGTEPEIESFWSGEGLS